MDLNEVLTERLRELEAQKLRRRLRRVEPKEFPCVTVEGIACLNFSSNDYLGLSSHPVLRQAAEETLQRTGTGSGASRLICGNLPEHEALEESLARFKQTASALAFSSGFAAALGTIPALVGEGDLVIVDKLSHACLIDAARLSGATLRVFRHNDVQDLSDILSKRPATGNVLIVTESVFSMDGDCAPLVELVELKEKHDAWLMVDEAHSTGLYGEKGRGLVQKLGLSSRVDIQMGTLSKALGASGGFIAGSEVLRDYLLNQARSFIFSTAPMPVMVSAARAAVELVQTGEGDLLRKKLWENVAVLRSAWKGNLPDFASAILPWIVGDEDDALRVSQNLLERGFLIPAVRYPTVKRGEARLRVTVSARHETAHLHALMVALTHL